MMPAASNRRTRSRHGRAERPTRSASRWMVERPLRCNSARILMSMRSRAGGRLGAMDLSAGWELAYRRHVRSPNNDRLAAPEEPGDLRLRRAHHDGVRHPGGARAGAGAVV